MKKREPTPRGFVINAWYEEIDRIRREEPRRYFLFSPVTKHCLFIYLMMKQRHEQTAATRAA
jgi:hypothetical protein